MKLAYAVSLIATSAVAQTDVLVKLYSDGDCGTVHPDFSSSRSFTVDSCYANVFQGGQGGGLKLPAAFNLPLTEAGVVVNKFVDNCRTRGDMQPDIVAFGTCVNFLNVPGVFATFHRQSRPALFQPSGGGVVLGGSCAPGDDSCSSLASVKQVYYDNGDCFGDESFSSKYPTGGECMRFSHGTQSMQRTGFEITMTDYVNSNDCTEESATEERKRYLMDMNRCYKLSETMAFRLLEDDEEAEYSASSAVDRRAFFMAGVLLWHLILVATNPIELWG